MDASENRSLWSRTCLCVLIPTFSPQVLYYLNKIASKVIRNRTDGYIDHESVFDQAFPSFPAHSISRSVTPIGKPQFITNGFLESSKGNIAFKKLPNSPILPDYLKCQLEGLAYFDTVFRRVGGWKIPYGDVMVAHHRILATGSSGRRSYSVGFSQNRSTDVAGKLRHTDGRVAFPVRDRKAVKAVLRALTEVDCYPAGWWDVKIDGISPKSRSKAKRVRQGYDIVHPDGKYIPLYFAKMGECMTFMRYLLADTKPKTTGQRELMLRVLATYFHLGIHAHAFVRINQSLLWSQVNYLLMLSGRQPVHHGYVDLVAAFLDTDHFCNYFIRYISDHSSILNFAYD